MRFGIRTSDAEALEKLSHHLPAASRPSVSPVVDHMVSVLVGGTASRPGLRRFHLAYVNGMRFARTLDLEALIEAVAFDLERHVASSAPRRLVIHAGVVGWGGRAVLIPGRSGSGKSTLVARLVREGAVYYSDEFAFLDRGGRAHAFRRPLRMHGDGGAKRALPLSPMDGAVPPPLPVGCVLLTGYRPGARWRPRRLPAARATLELLAHSVNGRLAPRQAIAALREVASSAEVLKGERGEADELARWLDQAPRTSVAAATAP